MKYLLFTLKFFLVTQILISVHPQELSAHAMNMATYTFFEDDNGVWVDITFDAETFDQSAGANGRTTDFSNEALINYLHNRFCVTINEALVNLHPEFVTRDDKLIHIRFKTEFKKGSVQHVNVINHCLLDVDDHINLIKFKMNDRIRMFKMNKDKTNIILHY